MKVVFVDASGWIAIANKSDEWHSAAVEKYDSLSGFQILLTKDV
jgi:predicted nucleic acid-binding protein